MPLRALIVDDEYPAREELRYLLNRFTCVEVVGEAANAPEARKLIKAVEYDVVFLDIQMPGINGIDLARELGALKNPPHVVFVTAYSEYAVDAFAVAAIDYLLKPVHEERLWETINRLKGPVVYDEEVPLSMLAVEKDNRIVPIAVSDIIFVYAERERTFVRTYDDRAITRFTLEQLTDRLPKSMFFRCYRSYLVNINHVREIKPHLNGSYILYMNDQDGSEVLVSRSRVNSLKERFGLRQRLRKRKQDND